MKRLHVPVGVVWEAFPTSGEATSCGTSRARGSVALRVGPAPAPGLAASCCG